MYERRPDNYDRWGIGYQQTRREDPRLARQIHAALGAARTVVNVGAGAGSYEPKRLNVIAVEPSEVMIVQRPRDAAPVVRAVAEALPFADGSFDAGMALWTIHHWSDLDRGLAELRRVARRVVVVAIEASVMNRLWLTRDYWPGMARDRRPEIEPEMVVAKLGGQTRIEPMLIPRDCVDGFGEAYWARPEAYLGAHIRVGMSCFQRLEPTELEEGLGRLDADLRSGAWDARHGSLRHMDELDCGHRLVIADV
ncbi:MAG TPA: class I SAM-dependent methyltransferase [Ktedonobacterales bacterium]|nr:class I SAM-dependent methyltransferase [Ktedonobacterales bacterium]